MAHKTLIDGTAYEIKGGKTLIDGTAYSIKSGKTLIGGTAYEVGFVKNLTVTMTQGVTFGGYIEYDSAGEIQRISDPGTYQVLSGTRMYVYIDSQKEGSDAAVFFNGECVATGYDYNISGNIYTRVGYHFTLTNNIAFYKDYYGKSGPAIYINEV